MIMRKLWALAALSLFVTSVTAEDTASPPDPASGAPARLSVSGAKGVKSKGGKSSKGGHAGFDLFGSDCCYDEQQYYLFPENEYVDIYGWIDAGFTYNGSVPASRYNGPYNQVDRNEGALNQLYLVGEHKLDCCEGLDFGGRIDLMFGSDFYLAQSDGLERRQDGSDKWNGEYYGLALPQMYGEVGNKTISAKIGHFYTPIGYEGVPAVNNFFYSKSYSYQFAGPFTHWGGIATWNPHQQISIEGGLVNGWDALDRDGNRTSFVGKATVRGCDDLWSVSFGVITGDERTFDGQALTNRTRYSLIGSLQLTDRVQYVINHWLGNQADEFGNGQSAEWYGIDQYLYYELNCNLKVGGRFEWFRDDDGVRVGLNRPSNPNKPPFVGNFYSLTLGANWTPMPNLMIRPEVRYDWFDGTGVPYDDGNKDSQFTLGMDAILRF
jgi:hypothetical protein